jgi:hypothetical protein
MVQCLTHLNFPVETYIADCAGLIVMLNVVMVSVIVMLNVVMLSLSCRMSSF